MPVEEKFLSVSFINNETGWIGGSNGLGIINRTNKHWIKQLWQFNTKALFNIPKLPKSF